MRKLETLEAWRCSRELARAAYRLTLQKPLRQHFGLADQIRRAAASVPANIVEGYALGTTAQFVRCLQIALGSACELFVHLELVRDMELALPERVSTPIALTQREIALLTGLVRKLKGRDGA